METIEKIKTKIKRLKNEHTTFNDRQYPDEKMNQGAYSVLVELEQYIDALEKGELTFSDNDISRHLYLFKGRYSSEELAVARYFAEWQKNIMTSRLTSFLRTKSGAMFSEKFIKEVVRAMHGYDLENRNQSPKLAV